MIYRVVMRTVDAEEVFETDRLEACPALVRAFVLNNDVPSADWLGAEVYLEGKLLERIAYNGRKLG